MANSNGLWMKQSNFDGNIKTYLIWSGKLNVCIKSLQLYGKIFYLSNKNIISIKILLVDDSRE
jgi:hypothetical protein